MFAHLVIVFGANNIAVVDSHFRSAAELWISLGGRANCTQPHRALHIDSGDGCLSAPLRAAPPQNHRLGRGVARRGRVNFVIDYDE